VRIYKEYGDNAIDHVTEDPYRLANDFYGIGFFSADKVAQSIGLAPDSPQRMRAAIKHVLAASREFGHRYLTQSQIRAQVRDHELKTAEPDSNLYEFRVNEPLIPYETELTIPKKFQHVDVEKILEAQTRVDELLAVLKKVHP